jgi:peptidoglycan/xylan/chitin deacetylase (PgdA/CDA1 family)
LGQNILITVDDGYASIRDNGWPLLKAAGIPMVLFISTGPIDNGNADYMSWDDLRRLKAEGVTIAHHGTGHLHSIHAGVSETIRDYLKASVRFQEELGEAPTIFAWPYGEYSPALITAFKAGGVRAAFGQFSGPLATTNNIFALPRFPINEAYGDLDRFKLVTNSYPLNLTIHEPLTPLVSEDDNPPSFRFSHDGYEDRVPNMTCYPSHSGTPIKPEENDDGTLSIHIDEPFPKGRHKVSCTLMRKSATGGDDAKWYWVSQPYFNFPELRQ